MKSSLMIALCFSALLLSSSCAAATSRQLSQAIASASSVAGPGETVNSNSKAVAENGQRTVSKVAATGSGAGTTVNCEQEAKNGQVKSKECGGGGAAAASSSSSSWDTAPACKKAPSAYKVEFGTVDKKPWGFDDGVSCALRGAKGEALA